jgi:methionine-rich copper-binding protein CopC
MSLSQDGSGFGIYAQRYDATGNTVGSETRVNTTTFDHQFYPSVATLSGGDYVVTWTSLSQDGSGHGIYAQLYDATGNTVGSETRVNTTTASEQYQPTVAALSNGGYVVTWGSLSQDGSGWGVYAQRYDATGNAVGSETLVNTTTAGDVIPRPAVAALSGGGYVVTWMSDNQDGSGFGVYAQRYDATGNTVGSETLVNTTTASDQLYPSVAALSDGGYVVTWSSSSQDGSGVGIYAQRYDATGNTVGSETLVSATTASDHEFSTVAALSDGGYVVTWSSLSRDGSGYDVYSRVFAFTAGNEPPSITSDGGETTAAVSVTKNTTAVTTVTATDPDAGQTLSYSISGGADAGKFTIGSTTGALSFITAPNFEAPTDTGGNNVYDVTVQVADGVGGIDTQAIAVTVTDQSEVPYRIIRVSTDANGAQGESPSISAEGRYVAFTSYTLGDLSNVFVRDLQTGANNLVSADFYGQAAGGFNSSISADGRYVAFSSNSQLATGFNSDLNTGSDVFVRDLQTGVTALVSVRYGERTTGNGGSDYASISADGRYVAFESEASNLLPDSLGGHQIFVRDMQTGVSSCVSTNGSICPKL